MPRNDTGWDAPVANITVGNLYLAEPKSPLITTEARRARSLSRATVGGVTRVPTAWRINSGTLRVRGGGDPSEGNVENVQTHG